MVRNMSETQRWVRDGGCQEKGENKEVSEEKGGVEDRGRKKKRFCAGTVALWEIRKLHHWFPDQQITICKVG